MPSGIEIVKPCIWRYYRCGPIRCAQSASHSVLHVSAASMSDRVRFMWGGAGLSNVACPKSISVIVPAAPVLRAHVTFAGHTSLW